MHHVSRKVIAGLAVAVGMSSSAAIAEPALNRCWGEIASQIAQMDTSGVDANGGGMGIHTRAAAGQGTTFGETFGNFNVGTDADGDGKIDPGSKGRTGVGNVSTGLPHVLPGQTVDPNAANGQHAINNSNAGADDVTTGVPAGGFSNIIDPLTGAFGPNDSDLHCSLESQGGDFTQ